MSIYIFAYSSELVTLRSKKSAIPPPPNVSNSSFFSDKHFWASRDFRRRWLNCSDVEFLWIVSCVCGILSKVLSLSIKDFLPVDSLIKFSSFDVPYLAGIRPTCRSGSRLSIISEERKAVRGFLRPIRVSLTFLSKPSSYTYSTCFFSSLVYLRMRFK